ncbi:MAG: hypothetical protein IJQ29_06710, partial [Synergistaceae bacterium]|nr:hypothetical protein [Synergistaceae bacterium]
VLLKFANLYCCETARVERYKFVLANIVKNILACRTLYFNFQDLYFDYKLEDNKTPEVKPKIQETEIINNNNAINNRRTFADEIASLLGGTVVMIKSDAEAESEAEADSEDLNLENENNDGDE